MDARRPPPLPAGLFDDDDDEADAAPPAARLSSGPVLPPEFGDDLLRLGRRLPAAVHLGTSSWSFPGWQGIVYGGGHGEAQLARGGLTAYSRHPVLRTVGIDRTFYQPLTADEFARYAQQVPESFRFVVKAPALVTEAVTRAERGAPATDNTRFLDAATATAAFVRPVLEGLGARAGPLVFQFSPLPRALTRDEAAPATIERIGAFLAALPRELGGIVPTYAVELRNGELLTPRFVRMLRAAGARPVIAIHPRMPEAGRQSAALRAMDALVEDGDEWLMKGPLVVRWSLHAGFRYDEAKNRYAPFDRLIDVDLVTRGVLAHLVHVAIRSSQPAFVIVNNKAEGSAPLSCIELARAIVA
jgi:uncharacterized protein YecE (DUF72 family)